MTLPTFLGIGVPKAGTTWLYELLATHPEVYLPTKVKDIRFFNHFYDLGIDWYQNFFPSDIEAADFKAIGEITVHYLYCEECPQRITSHLERTKLLLMLRNPADRIWSHYKHRARLSNYQGSFEQFLEDHPEAIRFSFYSSHIKRYLTYVDPDQLLILLFDRIFTDIDSTRDKIAEFLEIDPHAFPDSAGSNIVNRGFIPRYRSVYSIVNRGARLARDRRLHWPIYAAKKIGLKRMISVQGGQSERMSADSRQRMLALFDQEISELETLLQTDLSQWRS